MGNSGGTICHDKENRVAGHALAPARFVTYLPGTDIVIPPLADGYSGCVAITDSLQFMDPIKTHTNGQYATGEGVPCNFSNDGVCFLEAGEVINTDDDITVAIHVDGLGGVGVRAAAHAGFIYGKAIEGATVAGMRFLFAPRHLGR